MQIPILFSDVDIIVIHKPAGLPAQPNQWPKNVLLKGAEPVHRLDQRVSGLMLLSKNKQSAAVLSQAFSNKQVQKKYRAVVGQLPKEPVGLVEHWLVKNHQQQKAKAYKEQRPNSKQCLLVYNVAQSSNKYHLLNIELQTGRFHQIRAQLAAMASPIVGDIKYGYARTIEDGSILLQCYELQFNHPSTQKELNFQLPIPENWLRYGFTDVV